MTDATAPAAAAPGADRRKLLLFGLPLLALVAGGGGFAFWKTRAAHDADADADADDAEAEAEAAAHAKRKPTVFLPIEAFTVNLADEDADRFAQVAVVLELADGDASGSLTARMPALRSALLMVIASRRATDLLSAEGKNTLADDIAAAAGGELGWKRPDPEPQEAEGHDDGPPPSKAGDAKAARRRAKRKPAPKPEPNPVVSVHFSQFIVQ